MCLRIYVLVMRRGKVMSRLDIFYEGRGMTGISDGGRVLAIARYAVDVELCSVAWERNYPG